MLALVPFVVKKEIYHKVEKGDTKDTKDFFNNTCPGTYYLNYQFVNYRITFTGLIPIMDKKKLCGLTPGDILQVAEIPGLTIPAVISVTNSLYKKRIRDIREFPKISGKLKHQLEEIFITGIYNPESSVVSFDGTTKYLFRNDDGLVFETVYMSDGKRNTVCISSQSGCRMGCPFCATGRLGFMGDLSAGDIVNQVISLPEAGKINHIVFMGMGEPMDNIENVLKVCTILTSQWGLALSPRDITVSTVGIVPGIERLLAGSDCNLAFSLFSPFPDERVRAVPAERLYPAEVIIGMMKNYHLKKKRRMSIAYVMMKDINDTEKHLQGLKDLLRGSPVRINLIPYHPVSDGEAVSSPSGTMMHFKHELVISGISASVRRSRGADISAACGLLASGSVS